MHGSSRCPSLRSVSRLGLPSKSIIRKGFRKTAAFKASNLVCNRLSWAHTYCQCIEIVKRFLSLWPGSMYSVYRSGFGRCQSWLVKKWPTRLIWNAHFKVIGQEKTSPRILFLPKEILRRSKRETAIMVLRLLWLSYYLLFNHPYRTAILCNIVRKSCFGGWPGVD